MGSMDQVAGGMGTRAMQSYIEAKVSRVPRADTNGSKSILLACLGLG